MDNYSWEEFRRYGEVYLFQKLVGDVCDDAADNAADRLDQCERQCARIVLEDHMRVGVECRSHQADPPRTILDLFLELNEEPLRILPEATRQALTALAARMMDLCEGALTFAITRFAPALPHFGLGGGMYFDPERLWIFALAPRVGLPPFIAALHDYYESDPKLRRLGYLTGTTWPPDQDGRFWFRFSMPDYDKDIAERLAQACGVQLTTERHPGNALSPDGRIIDVIYPPTIDTAHFMVYRVGAG